MHNAYFIRLSEHQTEVKFEHEGKTFHFNVHAPAGRGGYIVHEDWETKELLGPLRHGFSSTGVGLYRANFEDLTELLIKEFKHMKKQAARNRPNN